MPDANILIWLPSPMGDAILCTPAIKAVRDHFNCSRISFFAEPVVRDVLSPTTFNDQWLLRENKSLIAAVKKLYPCKFTHALLFKNSFSSALAAFLARIPVRVGYVRQGRAGLLTHKLYPEKLADGQFKPLSMIDYYLAVARTLGADCSGRDLELSVDPDAADTLTAKIPETCRPQSPVVVIVPGGAFGPSKCWPSQRFAKTADWLTENYNATVIVSVSPHSREQQIADTICSTARRTVINAAARNLSIAELKALFSLADLVISNDTGPRHIAIALRRKVITLFGPNDHAWTETGCENEIKIIGSADCAPCAKGVCSKETNLCMLSITVEMVCDAVKKFL